MDEGFSKLSEDTKQKGAEGRVKEQKKPQL